MKLDDIVASVRGLHGEQFLLAERDVSISLKGRMDERIEVPTTRAIMMGRFYELLTRGLFGGKLGDVYHVRAADEEVIVRPDVVDTVHKRLFECKAICSGQSGTLLDTQINGYMAFAAEKPEYDISFVFYRHVLHGIKGKWEGTARELFRDLARDTAYVVVLPFQMVLDLHDPTKGSTKYIYRYDGQTEFDCCSCLRSSALTKLLVNPEEVLQEMGLSYQIERRMAVGCCVQGNRVRDFPVVYVREKFNQKLLLEDEVPF